MPTTEQKTARSAQHREQNIARLADLGIPWQPTGRKSGERLRLVNGKEYRTPTNWGNGSPDRPSKMLRRRLRAIKFGRA